MWSYVARRVVIAIVIIYVVVTFSFFMIRLMPGNPMEYLQQELIHEGSLTPQQIQQRVAAIYGVSPKAPVWRQYLQYMSHALRGNLGTSITNPGETVMHVIASSLPWTIFAVGVALLVSFAVGVAIGTMMAAFKDTHFGKAATLVVSFLSAIPNYLIAIVLIYFLSDVHHIFPLGGAYSVNVTVGFDLAFITSIFLHAALPIAAYVITAFGGWALTMKGVAVSTLGSEYVRAAESRGLGGRRITQSYIGRNSMLPMVTSLALSLGYMFGGSVFIETLFSYPGIGYYLITAVGSRDYSVMMGCFILITVAVVAANLLVDLLYPMVDPRIANPAARKRVKTGMNVDPPEQTAPVGSTMA